MQKVLGQTLFAGTQLPAAKPRSKARNARASVQATIAAPPRLDTSISERVPPCLSYATVARTRSTCCMMHAFTRPT